ncbi:14711_t:CDS:2, partial [Dentiscutata erythropus]
MRLEYRVKLPDHDWVVAKRHKLILSVYTILNMERGKYRNSEAVTYSGSTFIRVHSGKHDSSTAYSYGKNFDELMVEEKLHDYTKMDGQPKPVIVMLSDGVLTLVWEDTIIDGYPVLAKYINPSEEPYYLREKTATWIENHSQSVMIQVVVNLSEVESSRFFQNDFFSPPLLTQQKPRSICAASMSISDNTTHFSSFLLSVLMEGKLIPPDMNLQYIPFDWYCPTVNKSINEYLCSYCKRYFALKKALKYHTRGCPYKQLNLLVEPDMDTPDFQTNNISIHNYRHGEFLVSNKNYEAIWVDEEVIPEDLSETYHQ